MAMASRDSTNPFSPSKNSGYRQNMDNRKLSLHSIFNKLPLSKDSQINIRASPSRTAYGAAYTDAAAQQQQLQQQQQDLTLANRGLNFPVNGNGCVNGPYGAHFPNVVQDAFGRLLYNKLHGSEQVSRGTNHHASGGSSHFYDPYNPIPDGQEQRVNLEPFRGRIVALAKDQICSGVLQSKFDMGLSVSQIEMILWEVLGHLNVLMKYHFGGQFVQKLFLACDEYQQNWILRDITGCPHKLIQTCATLNGSKSMQRILDKLTSDDLIRLVTCVLGDLAAPLSNDRYASRVIQYCVNNFSPENNTLIFTNIANDCYEVSRSKSGCVVIQDCVSRSTGYLRELLVASIAANALELAADPYGNYVVQHLIGLNIAHTLENLFVQFKGHFASFSCDKFASHVVQKLLFSSSNSNASAIIKELISSPEQLRMFLSNPYANYVVQSALSVSKVKNLPEFKELVELIEAEKNRMATNIYGQKILSWFKK